MKETWTPEQAKLIFNLPLTDLIYKAQTVHRKYFPSNRVQISALLSIKTGGCPENCSYCPQSALSKTDIEKTPLLESEEILEAAKKAKKAGASRFCMGAAWRGPRDRDLRKVCGIISLIKAIGLETCASLGLLGPGQAESLKEAGLDFYNHNIDTSEEFYGKIITTRTFQDRLSTLESVRKAGLKVCCGGIIGMGENNDDRIKMLVTLANFEEPPESVPINKLIPIPGTPLEKQNDVDPFDFIRTIALARILMPESVVRLSAGRDLMSDELQAMCFLSGANSIFYGEKLLTTDNPLPEDDIALFARLGIEPIR
ncbi:MAG: biotin synthase BioB [Victivallaceae bacterium]